MEWFTAARWSPYGAGIGIGILSALALLLADQPLACSTSFARTAGLLEKSLRRKGAAPRPYFAVFKPVLDWQWFLVAGIVIGGFLSAFLSGTFEWRIVHDWWATVISPNPVTRLAGGFAGGILVGFGARWAGGCTSGHGISGLSQLSVSSLVAAAGFFAGGIATACLLAGLFG